MIVIKAKITVNIYRSGATIPNSAFAIQQITIEYDVRVEKTNNANKGSVSLTQISGDTFLPFGIVKSI